MWPDRLVSQFDAEVWICPIQYGILAKGGGGSTSAPPSVDPIALANAQTQTNLETATRQSQLNNVNTTSPFGETLFSLDPNTNQWSLNQNLSPELQQLFGTQQNAAQQQALAAQQGLSQGSGFGSLGYSLADSGANALGFISPSGFQAGPLQIMGPEGSIQDRIDASNVRGLQQSLDLGSGGIQPGVDLSSAGNIQKNLNLSGAGNIQQGVDFSGAGPVQKNLDLSGAGNVQGTVGTDFANQVQQAQNAAYGAQTQYLDPQFSQARSDLAQQLADQGIGINNAAYTRATGDLSRQQQQAYQGAQDAAVAAGNQEQAQLFGESLGAGQFANTAQAQRAAQLAAQGQFTNAAQLQNVQQLLNQGQFANTAQAQGAQQLQNQGLFANAAQLQGVQQTLNQGQFTNAAQAQAANELAQQGQFYNQSALGTEQQALIQQQAQNQAQQQGYGQNLTNAQINNQAQNQQFTQNQQLWQDPLTYFNALTGAGNQNFGNSLSALQGLQPNLSWAGQLPTFGGSPTTVSPTNVVGAGQVANQAALNRFNAQNTLNNQLFNGLGSLGSVLGGGTGTGGGGLGGLFGGAQSLFGGGGGFGGGDFGGLLGGGALATGLTDAGTAGGFFGDALGALAFL